MPDYSVVTCVNRPEVYDSVLLDSVYRNRGERDIEIIPLINTGNQYSASWACNVAIEVARSDRLVIAHQDVRLRGPDWFALLDSYLESLPDDWAVVSAAGIAAKYGRADVGRWGGASRAATVAVGRVWDSDDCPEPYWDGERQLQPIHAADECLLVLNRRHSLRFDPMFDGFHFYGIDLSLQARAAGYGVYGADLPITHYGKYSASMVGAHRYWVYLRYLHNKWRFLFPEVFTTHMHWVSDRITSYIPSALESDAGVTAVKVRAAALGTVRIAGDHHWGIDCR